MIEAFHLRLAEESVDWITNLAGGTSRMIEVRDSDVVVDVPFPCTDWLFYIARPGELEISNDIRRLYRPEMRIDPRGVFSLLQFGAMVPPYTVFEDIRIFVPGIRYTVCRQDLAISESRSITWSTTACSDGDLDARCQTAILSSAIDEQLIEMCPERNPIVLFSGGVDSGVLAARIADMGWADTTLMHYSFGPEDPDTIAAMAMAERFNLPLDLVFDRDVEQVDVLGNAASIFGFPFCDHSCLPTVSLSRAVVREYDCTRTVIDGTGADGSFGMFGRAHAFRRLYFIPRKVRSCAASIYSAQSMWRRSSRTEYCLRLLKRTVDFSILGASIAQNPLLGIAFDVPASVIEDVVAQAEWWIQSISPSRSIECLIPAMDVGLVCAGIFAQKAKSTLMQGGYRISFPYLSAPLVDLALQHCRFWPGSRTPKRVLKALLEEAIPRDLVYRQKRGFTANPVEEFSSAPFQEHLTGTLRNDSLLGDFVNRPVLQELRGRISRGARLPPQTYNFVWAAVFLESWMTQVKKMG